jgi:hypothetical protein
MISDQLASLVWNRTGLRMGFMTSGTSQRAATGFKAVKRNKEFKNV